MKTIKAVINRVVNPIAKKRGIIHGKIILEWEKIVGSQYASYCAPIKIAFRQGYRSYGTLHIKVNPSHALLLSHSQDLVIEKVNTFFGYPAVSALRIMQVPFTPRVVSQVVNVVRRQPLMKKDLEDISPQERLDKALADLEGLIQDEKSKKNRAS